MFANSHKLLLSWLCAFTLLSGCSLFGSEEREELGADLLEEELYQEAMNALESSSYQTAIRYLSILESNFPFGQYAEQAQLELIHAYYKSYAHDQALSVADRFIRLHPEHVNVDYAYYMARPD